MSLELFGALRRCLATRATVLDGALTRYPLFPISGVLCLRLAVEPILGPLFYFHLQPHFLPFLLPLYFTHSRPSFAYHSSINTLVKNLKIGWISSQLGWALSVLSS
ncbi:uncharacterized protein LOC141634502 [Silene latifolia]|uniref:uncharacterized protein LOC141634502 n=1 Tax=Silene latifolia TaxID=37657 RepID=UPI003D77E6AE